MTFRSVLLVGRIRNRDRLSFLVFQSFGIADVARRSAITEGYLGSYSGDRANLYLL
jgi:hypothetical protein